MKPIEEQVILITGATDGLGKAIATELAQRGATILLHGRSDERGQRTVQEITEKTGNSRLKFYRADLSRLSDVRALGTDVRANEKRIDVLVNNAGIMLDSREESSDGNELVFQVNYLSHVLLTRLLLPLLKRTAPARIVNVASAGQHEIDFDDIMLEKHFDRGVSYRRSKLAQIMFTIDLANELRGDGITVNCLHPGTYMPTKMVLGRFTPANSLEEGARATIRLALDPGLASVSGRYFHMQEEARAHDQAYDEAARTRLHAITEHLLSETPHEV
jgi:NAD(P)-dependent dehydrogenase (short-subunit alcohol dehydrogenase family)